MKRWLDWRRLLVYTHRWLGIAGGLLFVAWFASGIVMMYARMPELAPGEALARAAPIDLTAARFSPADLSGALDPSADRLRVSMLAGRPVYRLQTGRAATTVFADTGEPFRGLSPAQAESLVRELVPEHASTIHYDTRLDDADQWTFGVRGDMPVHRVALGDTEDSYLYLSDRSGEPVMKTTRRDRRWGYAGAVIHWLYFTPFRRQAALWNQSIIWLSLAGSVTCLLGLIWGVWRYSRVSRYRLKSGHAHTAHAHSPYAGFMRWHHYAGLIFGLTTLTWVVSGLLSMGPFWGAGTAPTRQQRDAVSGGSVTLADLSLPQLRAAVAAFDHAFAPKALELVRFQGEAYAIGVRASSPDGDHRAAPVIERRIVSVLTPARGTFAAFPADAVRAAAHAAMPGITVEEETWLREYDAYYYDRDGARPLPVLRVRYADDAGTWLYLDPQRGAIVLREDRSSRVERWLYHGLHSLDFPFLYYRRPLWDLVIIVLSAGGITLSVTTMVPAWRRLRRHLRRGLR